MEAKPFLIGGEWRTSDSINEVRFPFTGEVIAKVCQASGDEVEAAIKASVAGFAATRALPAHARSPFPTPALGPPRAPSALARRRTRRAARR